MAKMLTAFRFFAESNGKLVSEANTSCEWTRPAGAKCDNPTPWSKIDAELSICNTGFHACKTVYNALQHRRGHVLAKVEYRGAIIESSDGKFCAPSMRIHTVYSPRAMTGLACLGSALSLVNFEKWNPQDTRPRAALDLALRYVGGEVVAGLESAASAARSSAESAASAARSAASAAASSAASSAASAAWSAARSSAESAASAARSAAESESAAAAARSAAESAWSAAAARSAAARSAAASARSAAAAIERFNALALQYLEVATKKDAGVDFLIKLIPSQPKVLVQA